MAISQVWGSAVPEEWASQVTLRVIPNSWEEEFEMGHPHHLPSSSSLLLSS
jgi:hypothetical protein